MSLPPTKSEKIQQILRRGREIATSETEPDEKDIKEEAAYERAKRRMHIQNEALLLDLRNKYGRGLLRFMWSYSVVTLILLILDAYQVFGFNLPDEVLVALVGGTAVSVLGVVGTIAAGLFRVK